MLSLVRSSCQPPLASFFHYSPHFVIFLSLRSLLNLTKICSKPRREREVRLTGTVWFILRSLLSSIQKPTVKIMERSDRREENRIGLFLTFWIPIFLLSSLVFSGLLSSFQRLQYDSDRKEEEQKDDRRQWDKKRKPMRSYRLSWETIFTQGNKIW